MPTERCSELIAKGIHNRSELLTSSMCICWLYVRYMYNGSFCRVYVFVYIVYVSYTHACYHILCAYALYRVDEMCISRQPILFIAYLNQYLPWISRQVCIYLCMYSYST